MMLADDVTADFDVSESPLSADVADGDITVDVSMSAALVSSSSPPPAIVTSRGRGTASPVDLCFEVELGDLDGAEVSPQDVSEQEDDL